MRFRSISRQLPRSSNYHTSGLAPLHQHASFYRFQSNRFSSNLDNDKDNVVPTTSTKNETIKKVSSFQKSLQENLKRTMSNSFWSCTALDKEHKEWVDEYSKQVSKDKTTYFELKSFKDISKWIGYIGCIGYDGIQRFRMRPLKATLISYEEFMIGALHSFKTIQNIDKCNTTKISKCFAQDLCDEITDIKHALFEDEGTYNIDCIQPFANKLAFEHMESDANRFPDIQMLFNVRYYYSLQNVKNENEIKHKCVDIEWKGFFEPQVENEKFKKLNLSDKGFLINTIEIDNF